MNEIVKDIPWLENTYLPTYRKRLADNHKFVKNILTELKIPFLDRNAGLFIWVDFREFMTSSTKEAEIELF